MKRVQKQLLNLLGIPISYAIKNLSFIALNTLKKHGADAVYLKIHLKFYLIIM